MAVLVRSLFAAVPPQVFSRDRFFCYFHTTPYSVLSFSTLVSRPTTFLAFLIHPLRLFQQQLLLRMQRRSRVASCNCIPNHALRWIQ